MTIPITANTAPSAGCARRRPRRRMNERHHDTPTTATNAAAAIPPRDCVRTRPAARTNSNRRDGISRTGLHSSRTAKSAISARVPSRSPPEQREPDEERDLEISREVVRVHECAVHAAERMCDPPKIIARTMWITATIRQRPAGAACTEPPWTKVPRRRTQLRMPESAARPTASPRAPPRFEARGAAAYRPRMEFVSCRFGRSPAMPWRASLPAAARLHAREAREAPRRGAEARRGRAGAAAQEHLAASAGSSAARCGARRREARSPRQRRGGEQQQEKCDGSQLGPASGRHVISIRQTMSSFRFAVAVLLIVMAAPHPASVRTSTKVRCFRGGRPSPRRTGSTRRTPSASRPSAFSTARPCSPRRSRSRAGAVGLGRRKGGGDARPLPPHRGAVPIVEQREGGSRRPRTVRDASEVARG